MKKFREVRQDQMFLLPPSLEELIDRRHMVRVLSDLVDRLSARRIEDRFSGGGTPSYHPRMMLKVILYSYMRKLYSCRQMARALREELPFMWLSGMSRPDFNTVNRFRSEYFRGVLEDIFAEVLLFLHGEGYIDLKDYFVDGTKLEANAGKHSYIWRKNTERYKEAVKERIRVLFRRIDELNDREDEKYGEKDLPERGEESKLTSAGVREAAEAINKSLEEESDGKKVRKLRSQASKLEAEAEKLAKYEDQEAKLGGRNSCSRTDADATFMRMKDDTLRAAYNVQISTNGGWIVNYSAGQNASDSFSFAAHFDRIIKRGKAFMPETYTGDGAYGNQYNWTLLAQHNIGSYLKFGSFHHEQKRAFREDMFHRDNMRYDGTKDQYICPADRVLDFRRIAKRRLAGNREVEERVYECGDCGGCPHAEACKKGDGNRTVRLNPELEKYKEETRVNLKSEKGIDLRKRRGNEVETPFGDLRKNCRFTRFSLRGSEKVDHELGLLSLAHNLRKYSLKFKN